MDRRTFAKGAVAAALLPLSSGARGQPGPSPALRLRKNVQSMPPTDPFFANYANAVDKMHSLVATDRRSWRQQALIHLNFCVHGGSDFFHWHRHYITQFELICGELIGDSAFALPYWDWTANRGRIPEPFYDLNLLNVAHWNDPSNASSPNWGPVSTIGRRGLAKGRGLQDISVAGGNFTLQNISGILGLSEYDKFWGDIEGGPHGVAHVVVGSTGTRPSGHMGSGMSPLDPIFWLHHCNVDRLWEEWRNAGNLTPSIDKTYVNHFVDAKGNSVTTTATEALDAAKLGFRYDTVEPIVIAGRALPEAQKLLFAEQIGAGVAVVGQARGGWAAKVGIPTRIPLSVRNVMDALFSRRTFWSLNPSAPKQLSAEGGRLLFQLNNVSIDRDSDSVIVNVFVNCPYLEPGTPYTDPHYVGTFALFGGGHASGHAGRTIVVDASDALRGLLRSGRLVVDLLQVQLMAIPASEGGTSDATVTVDAVDAIRA